MGTKDKLIERFKKQPNDFTWDELVRLFALFGFLVENKGKTSGSRTLFFKDNFTYAVHKPHPANIIKDYLMKQILEFFIENGFIKNEDYG